MGSHILFIHAFLGSMGAIQRRGLGLGRGLAPLKRILKKDNLCEHAAVFSQTASEPEENIIRAGEGTLVCVYGGVRQII